MATKTVKKWAFKVVMNREIATYLNGLSQGGGTVFSVYPSGTSMGSFDVISYVEEVVLPEPVMAGSPMSKLQVDYPDDKKKPALVKEAVKKPVLVKEAVKKPVITKAQADAPSSNAGMAVVKGEPKAGPVGETTIDVPPKEGGFNAEAQAKLPQSK
jgi:hypothetical protein